MFAGNALHFQVTDSCTVRSSYTRDTSSLLVAIAGLEERVPTDWSSYCDAIFSAHYKFIIASFMVHS